MKKNTKRILFNIGIVFLICFSCLFFYLLYRDYKYYSVYDRDELLEFFSMKDAIVYNLGIALEWNFKQMLIYVPVIFLLEKTKLNRFLKIIITLGVTLVFSIVFIIVSLLFF